MFQSKSMVAILGVIKPWTCSYTVYTTFFDTRSCAILTYSVNWLSGLNRASKINVGFGFQNEARLQLCFTVFENLCKTKSIFYTVQMTPQCFGITTTYRLSVRRLQSLDLD